MRCLFAAGALSLAWEKSGRKDKADIPVSVQVKGDERSYMGRL